MGNSLSEMLLRWNPLFFNVLQLKQACTFVSFIVPWVAFAVTLLLSRAHMVWLHLKLLWALTGLLAWWQYKQKLLCYSRTCRFSEAGRRICSSSLVPDLKMVVKCGETDKTLCTREGNVLLQVLRLVHDWVHLYFLPSQKLFLFFVVVISAGSAQTGAGEGQTPAAHAFCFLLVTREGPHPPALTCSWKRWEVKVGSDWPQVLRTLPQMHLTFGLLQV